MSTEVYPAYQRRVFPGSHVDSGRFFLRFREIRAALIAETGEETRHASVRSGDPRLPISEGGLFQRLFDAAAKEQENS